MLRRLLLTLLLVFPAWADEYQVAQMVTISPTLWLRADVGTGVVAGAPIDTWTDQSGNGYNFTGTTTTRPVLTRSDNQENRFKSSEALLGTGWSNYQVTLTDAALANPVSGVAAGSTMMETAVAAGFYVYQSSVQAAGEVGVLSFYAKANGRNFAYGWTNSNIQGAYFNLATGTVQGYNGSGATATIESAGNGWYRCTVQATLVAGSQHCGIATSDTGARYAGWTGDAAKGLYVAGVQFRSSLADSTYLPTTTTAQYRGINGYPAVRFDGVDDYMSGNPLAAVFAGADKPISIFAAAYPAVTTAGLDIFSLRADVAANPYFFFRTTTGGRVDDAGTLKYEATGSPSVAVAIFSYISNGTTQNKYINNALIGTANYDIDVGALTVDNATIGAARNGGSSAQIFNGPISELILFNTALPANERYDIYKYLSSKYRGTY